MLSSFRQFSRLPQRSGCCCYHELSFQSPGEPAAVLGYHQHASLDAAPPALAKDWIRVEVQYAPLNPADINMVQGKYPEDDIAAQQRHSSFFPNHFVAGAEGIGRVTSEHSNFKIGDWVALMNVRGVFRSSLWLTPHQVEPLPFKLFNKQDPAAISTLFQLGGTSLRMLQGFISLQPGDWIIQNAGSSGVAWTTAQLCMALYPEVRLISLVRKRPNIDEIKSRLQFNRPDQITVLCEEDLARDALAEWRAEIRESGGRTLLLNAVGGESASRLLSFASRDATMVTYGGMSMQPVTVATPKLIFQNISLRGYWHSRWMTQESSRNDRHELTQCLIRSVLDHGVECPPVKSFDLGDWQRALAFAETQEQRALREKTVFRCAE